MAPVVQAKTLDNLLRKNCENRKCEEKKSKTNGMECRVLLRVENGFKTFLFSRKQQEQALTAN